MSRTKKIWCIVAVSSIALIGVVALWRVRDSQPTNRLEHKTITGIIFSYQQASDGMTVVVDDDATSSDKTILITENTMFTDDLVEQSIFNMKTGLYITVESEFWTQTYGNVYPAILVSPAT